MVSPGAARERTRDPDASFFRIGVVIPCYRVGNALESLIARIPPAVDHVVVVNDGCPELDSKRLLASSGDPRLVTIDHPTNRGVGAATVSGFLRALDLDCDIVVKLDGDGQYDPALIPGLVAPIERGLADCTKGNRFYRLDYLSEMPALRLVGNSILSIVNKAVSGYWGIMDPTNGFIAVHAEILRQLPLEKLSSRYFFESDLWFRLSTIRAVLMDVPLPARYRGENSALSPLRTMIEFPPKYLSRMLKRIFYGYFLRDFNIGSVNLIIGLFLLSSGALYGGAKWMLGLRTGVPATAGEVMIAAIQCLVGASLLLSFVNYDVANLPRAVQYPLLSRLRDVPESPSPEA